ncbi:rhamnan synthesis F family protein [Alteromonas sp. C1M14]|uniref:rhamnan synthesis F family protein n=1 Tax=Alteromonas sp. C1M14 TaxID=2841567 RepID=UPI001C09900D|nr:rhamnan synthesis F family protein [Alteromonas sp. C1M14]MBU2977233.1 glycosyl transferase family 1 [Alteromonas sp. C1M14]
MNSNLKKSVRRIQQSLEMTTKPKIAKAFKEAKRLGLFDVEWYQEHYGSFPHELAAFEDYLEKSKSSNVNPSANFDTELYLRCNVDIYLNGISPLPHYMYHGRHEGRNSSRVVNRWLPATELVPHETATWKSQKVAIVLHIFYPDFVEKFAQTLRKFPTSVDVFVTAATKKIERDATETFGSLDNVNQVKTALCENRGRNFGPFLVNFSKELLEYDLMCHMHSKKSLYSGREQTQWFDYLNNFLLKDKHVVKSVLRLFDEHKELGTYYPSSFWMMPSWVNHWTCNKPHAEGFVNDWGLDINDDFVNYPVGGMFWARPKAIKPILNKNYQYDDFPAEPLPNDGSWLHALERVIGLLAEKQGFKQFFYYPPLGRFTTDKTQISSSYYKTPEQLLSDVSNFDVVSFDIFDTVLRREFTYPDYAKYKLGKELTKLEYFDSAEEFVEHRNNAELACRKAVNFEGDIDIYQAYQQLAKQKGIAEELAASWADKEFYYDLAMALPKDEMVKIVHELNAKGREIWFVTDIYYTKAQITKMLRKIGISVPYKLFVSSDIKKRKDAGTMWTFIKQLVDESGQSFLHVGDNVRSDAQICGDFGLQNMHILNPMDKWSISGLAKLNSFKSPDEATIQKWGPLISHHGRYPFFGE